MSKRLGGIIGCKDKTSSMGVLLFLAFSVGCQPGKNFTVFSLLSSEVPRNPLTRWDVSSIPANGIFSH